MALDENDRRTWIWFGAALFLSSALIFSVEPLIGRLLLPRFGGTSLVWNTCLVFFQAGLLVGYAYAHLIASRLTVRAQVVVHLAVLGASLFFLPIDFGAEAPDPEQMSVWWLLVTLTVEAALPFAALSASAPLFQSWFSHTDHRRADDPYPLYAASNAGSLIALLAYPIVFEPALGLEAQRLGWGGAYVGFALLVVWIGALVFVNSGSKRPGIWAESKARRASFDAGLYARWGLYAALPSALLVSVTSYITTDVASVPLLWVLPLALYLLSFVVTFAGRRLIANEVFTALVPAALLPTASVVVFDFAPRSVWLLVAPHLAAFFIVAAAFHGALNDDRPEAEQASAFYLVVAAGGVLGGAFPAFAAPVLFDSVLEYPLLLGAAVAGISLVGRKGRGSTKVVLAGGVVSVAVTFLLWTDLHDEPIFVLVGSTLAAAFAVALWIAHRRPRAFAVLFCLFLAAALVAERLYGAALYQERSFLGRYRVTEKSADDETLFVMFHGTTVHGFQSADESRRREPMGYYAPHSGVGSLLTDLDARSEPTRVGVVGLGVGSLAAYASKDSVEMTFVEIDPLVVDLAADDRFFDYLQRCGSACRVVVGDGRVMLREFDEKPFDMLVLDAYDSDSIPLHLLTREAVELYLDRISEEGVLAFHLTNRYFDLIPVVGRLCEELSLHCTRYTHQFASEAMPGGRSQSKWVFASPDPEALEPVTEREGAATVPTQGPLWTDDYANIWRVLRR